MDEVQSIVEAGDNGNPSGNAPTIAVNIPAEKRGPGRPPGAKNKESGNPPPKSQPKAVKASPDTSEILDPAVIGDLFVALSEIGDDITVIAILAKARSKLPPRHYVEFVGELDKIRLGPRDKNLIRTAGIALAKKYPFLQRWGPEVIILVCGVQYAARMGNAFRKLNGLPDYKPEKAPSLAPVVPLKDEKAN